MLDLLPLVQDRFVCPCGDSELQVHDFVLPGMIPFATTSCPRCGRRFLSRLHTDFCSSDEFHCDVASGEVHSTAPEWFHHQLVTALRTRERDAPPLEKQMRRPLGPDVVIVNALDVVYGHCLHKLFSFSASKDMQGSSFLAIVPAFLKWLVPDAIDEVWIVNEPRFNMCFWNRHVADGIAQLKARCGRLRYQDLAWNHTVRIEDYTRIKSRDAGVAPARMTLSWREDRCWTLRGRPLPPAEAVLDQLRLYTLLLSALRQHVPDLQAYVTGYGQTGDFPSWIQDMRIVEHDPLAEQAWAKVAAKSHVALGVHGSNMILPTAHANSGVEIVPTHKWPTVQVTWEFANAENTTRALPRYRLLAESTSLSDVASIVLAQMRRQQSEALNWAIYQAGSPQDKLALRVAHHDLLTPFTPISCRDDDGQPI